MGLSLASDNGLTVTREDFALSLLSAISFVFDEVCPQEIKVTAAIMIGNRMAEVLVLVS